MPLLTRLPRFASERGNDFPLDGEKQSLSGSLPLLKQKFGNPTSFGLSRPVAGLTVRDESTDDKFGLKHEGGGVSTQILWDVKGEDLEMVPLEFPLERTHREIRKEACVVASRISKALRLMSVEAQYCSKQVKAKCRTTDFVSFRIRLFAGGENGQPVVVELQRRSGSASSFMRMCRAVLDAAEGKEAMEMLSVSARSLPPAFKMPVSSLGCLSHVLSADSGPKSDAKEALQCALGLFRSDRRDTSLLGLENLCCITDPVKTSSVIARCVSKSLIAPGEAREELRILIERDVFSDEDNDQEGPLHFRDHQRFLCLCVFANAISVCLKNDSLQYLLSDSWFAEFFVPLLVDELDRVETGLQNAFQATVCLRSLLSCSPTICYDKLIDNGTKKAVEKAYRIGQSRHELLACECRRCLDLFEFNA